MTPATWVNDVDYGTKLSDAATAIPAALPSIAAEDGYIFVGWKSTNTGAIYPAAKIGDFVVTEADVFTAHYEDKGNATIIFDYNGGTDGTDAMSIISGTPGDLYIDVPSLVDLTPTVTRHGYTGVWSTAVAPEVWGTFGAPGSIVTYKMIWTANKNLVTFDPGAGSLGAAANGTINAAAYEEDIDYGSIVGVELEPTPASGFVFTGWVLGDAVYNKTGAKNYVMPDAPVTFVAQYGAVGVAHVLLNYDGGTAAGNGSLSFSGYSGVDYTSGITLPTKTGYTLHPTNPWSTSNPSILYGTFGPVDSFVIHTAQWVPDQYDVTFDLGTHATSPASIADRVVSHGAAVGTVSAVTPATGYIFLGWNDGTGKIFNQAAIAIYKPEAHTDFVAEYVPVGDATVIFDYDGGVDGSGKYASHDSRPTDSTLTAPSGITKHGYIFSGVWDVDPLPTKYGAPGSITTYVAQYTKDSFAVNFVPGTDGMISVSTPATPVNVVYEDAVDSVITALPTVTANAGYKHIGWKANDGTGVYTDAEVLAFIVKDDVTFTAAYDRDAKATVIFNYDGGVNGTDTYAMEQGYEGDNVPTPTEPTKANYTFKEWDPAFVPGTTKFGSPILPTAFTAVWTPNDQIVTFATDANGVLSGTATTPIPYNTAVGSITATVTPKDGYELKGWATATGIYDEDAVEAYIVTGPVTFTATHAKISDTTVIFDYNGGTDGTIGYKVESDYPGADLTAVTPEGDVDFTREGHEFTGWDIDPLPTEFEGAPGEVITYVAQWDKLTYKVTFDVDDPDHGEITGTDEVPVVYGDPVGAGSIPSYDTEPGWVFYGWSDGTSIYEPAQVAAYVVKGDMTFTAIFIEDHLSTVVFDFDGGEDALGKKYWIKQDHPGKDLTAVTPDGTGAAPDFTKEGHEFLGWDTAPTTEFGSLALSPVTYTATWKALPQTVQFNIGTNGEFTADPLESSLDFSVDYGEKITSANIPAVTEDTGYVFVGWTLDGTTDVYSIDAVAAYVVNSVDDATDPLNIVPAVSFTAKYEDAADNVVIFDYNGGKDVNGDTSVATSGQPGTTYDVDDYVDGLERTGYVLDTTDPWLTTSSDTLGIFGAAGDYTTYTANWKVIEYEVNFVAVSPGNAHGSLVINTTTWPQDIAYGDTVGSAGNIPTAKADLGYVFVGWDDGVNGIYKESATEAYIVTGDVTFVAIYARSDKSVVVFDYNGGEGTTGEKYLVVQNFPGELVSDDAPIGDTDFTKLGYVFAGWEHDTTGDDITGKEYPALYDIDTYVAQWTPVDRQVTFLAGTNGTMTPDTATETVPNGAFVTDVPTISTNSYWKFLGWSMNGSTSYFSSDEVKLIPITEDTTFEAKYQEVVINNVVQGGSGGPTYSTAKLIVKAIDAESGKEIYNQNTTTIVGKKESVAAPKIEGYELAAGETDPVSITIARGDNEVTFKYNFVGTTEKPIEPTNPNVSDKIKELLETENHIKYLNGYEDGTVRPDGSITRAEVAMIFWRLLKSSAKNDAVSNTFADVSDDAWYAQAVTYLASIGIISGYADGSFGPDRAITRAEFAVIASRFDNLVTGVEIPFNDLNNSHWAAEQITSAYMKGWISGYPGGEFKMENSITRAEVVTIVNKMLGRSDTPATTPNYSDLSKSHWAYKDIIEASVEH